MSHHSPFHRNLPKGLALALLLAPLVSAAQGTDRQPPRANDKTTILAAPAADCAALDDPARRNRMDGLLFNLLWSCGRQSEIVQAPEVESFAETAESLTEALLAVDVQVNNSSPESGTSTTQSETSISYNPNTGTYCSAYNDSWEYYGSTGGGGFTGFARSTNNGATWQDQGAVGSTSMGDPSLTWRRADGYFYIATLESGGALSVWRSTNDCQSFTKVSVPSTGSDDKEILTVDNNPASPYYGYLYLVWTDFGVTGTPIRAMRSTNGGTTWSTPVNLSASGTVQGAWPAVAPNGDVYVAWLRYASWPSGNITVEVARSTNGGTSYTAVTSPLSNAVSPRDSAASTTCARPALNGNIRYLASPQIVVTSNGVLHVIYAYDPDGFNTGDVVNVYYRRSTDNGSTWSAQVQLNDVSTNDQYFGTLQADGLRLVAGWYDRRNDAGNTRQDYYKRVSTDAGVTWGANVRVSDVNSPIRLDPNLASCYHGDYDQSAVVGSGELMQWADDRNFVGTRNDPDVWSDATVAVPDFAVSCSPSSLTLPRGQSTSTTCTVTSSGGFSSAVSLSCANLPAGVSCAATPNPVTPPANGSASSTVTFTATTSATTGTFSVQVNGTSGATVRSANISLSVTVPDFSIACSPSSISLPLSQSRTTTCTVTSLGGFSSAVALTCGGLPAGVTCAYSPISVTPPSGGSASSTLTLTASSSATLGTFTVQAIGTSGALTHSANITLTVNNPLVVGIGGDYYRATCSASGGTPGYTYYWYVTPSYCDPCQLLDNGEPDICCVAAREGRELPPCPLQGPQPNVVCPEEGPYVSSPADQWTWDGTEAKIRCSATDAVNTTAFSSYFTRPAPSPDFTLSCSPTSVTVSPGGATSTTCTVTSLYSFTSSVTLSCANVPSGVTCTPSPNPITPPANGTVSSTVTLSAAAGTALGTYTVQVNGTGGGLTRTSNVTLNVTSGPLAATLSVVNWVATCNASGGTPPYTYRWYVRYPCDPCLIVEKERIARGESPSVLPCPFNAPDPELVCPWEGPYTSNPANQWQLYGDETGVRCNVIDAVGGSVTVTQLL